MKFRSFVAAAVILAVATSAAQAVQLVVINVKTHSDNALIPVGEQVVTFGIQVKSSDLIGAGTNPVLFVQDLTFAGNGIVPIQASPAAANKNDVQTIQSLFVDAAAGNTSPDPATLSDLSANGQKALITDSWWYAGATGVLQGINDGTGLPSNLTDPAYQLGPIKNIGTTGFQWTANGSTGIQAGATAAAAIASSSGATAVTGYYMVMSGFYGPNGSNALTQSALQGQFVNGVLTVPIAQIATTGNITFPGDNANAAGGVRGSVGSGTFLGLAGDKVSNGPTGNGTYNVLGGNPGIDPASLGYYYSFQFQGLGPILPEPGTFGAAGIGLLGMLFVWRRNRLRNLSN